MVAWPEIVQLSVPVGALPPVTPVRVAVNVMWSPSVGEVGADVTAIVGVLRPTVTESGFDVGRDAYVESPL